MFCKSYQHLKIAADVVCHLCFSFSNEGLRIIPGFNFHSRKITGMAPTYGGSYVKTFPICENSCPAFLGMSSKDKIPNKVGKV